MPFRHLLEIDAAVRLKVVTLAHASLDAQAVHDELSLLADDAGRLRLHVDFACVQKLTAAALGKLVSLHAELRATGGRLTLFNVRPPLYEVFRAARLTKLLDIRPASAEQPSDLEAASVPSSFLLKPIRRPAGQALASSGGPAVLHGPHSRFLRVEERDDVVVVQIIDPRLDGESMQAITDRVRSLEADTGRRQFEVDFGGVTFVTGSGLGQLAGLQRRLQEKGGRLTVSNVDAALYRVFEAARLTTLLDVRCRGEGTRTA